MAYTVNYSFNLFYDAINLGNDFRELANTRRNDLLGKIERNLSVLDSFSTGSIPKFTALKSFSDLDIFIVLDNIHFSSGSPNKVLQDVRTALSQYRTKVRKNGQAVTLEYATWPNVDIVPVQRVTNTLGDTIYYLVPDTTTNSWIKSNPQKHSETIDDLVSRHGSNFRKIIKMIKYWNLTNGSLLESYHIEVLAIKLLDKLLDDTPWDIFQFFENAQNLINSPLWYDFSFADGYITGITRPAIQKKIQIAANLSRRAWNYTYGTNDDDESAIKIWKQIFGDRYPAYG